jgi:hypothetical protein
MTEPVCVISGVGPGTGSALARRFARGGYRVAMLARNAQRLSGLERELPNSKAYVCDVSDAAQVEATGDKNEHDLGCTTPAIANPPAPRAWPDELGHSPTEQHRLCPFCLRWPAAACAPRKRAQLYRPRPS